jgi:hypothetical protein
MGKNAFRKPRPQPPRWYWLDSDGCWWCKNRKNCNSCKVLRQYRRDHSGKTIYKEWDN